jgi:hypothetical protein
MMDSTTNNIDKYKGVDLHWIITILLGLTLGAYGWIFSSVIDRIAVAENKIDSINTPLLQIQTDLAGIKQDISWLVKGSDEHNK